MKNLCCCFGCCCSDSLSIDETNTITEENSDERYKQELTAMVDAEAFGRTEELAARSFIEILTLESVNRDDAVPASRLFAILKSITSFNCGITQLNQVANACREKNIKIAFRANNSNNFSHVFGSNPILINITKSPWSNLITSVASVNCQTEEDSHFTPVIKLNVIDVADKINF